MARLLLLSVLVVAVAMPSFAAREPSAPRGLRKLLGGMFMFVFVYWLVVMFFTPV